MKQLFFCISLSVFLSVLPAYSSIVTVAEFALLDEQVSQSFTQTGVSAGSGVTVDLTYTFSANTGSLEENGRLGIESTFDQGAAGDSSVNLGEQITITISASNIMVPAGLTLTALDFGIPEVDLVKSAPNTGTLSWNWTSQAGTFTSTPSTQIGAQTEETFDGAGTFDLLTGTYSGVLSVVSQSNVATSGIRIVSGDDNIDSTLIARVIPEPGSALLIGLLGIALAFSRRRR